MSQPINSKAEDLFHLAAILGQQNDFEELLRVVSAHASFLFDADIFAVVMINPRTQKTIKTIVKGVQKGVESSIKLVQDNVIGWVSKNNKSFVSENITADTRFSKNLFKTSILRSVMCTQLLSEGICLGYLFTAKKSTRKKFNNASLRLFENFSIIVSPYLSNVQKIQEYFKTPLPDEALLQRYERLGLFGKSSKFIDLLKAIEAATRCDVRVLLEGQSGTGKELVAHAIHKLSARKDGPFVTLDCSTIIENLFGSEFFGHKKGAFTGATQDRRGLIEEADGGTLFIDEIVNLPLDMQAKFLRVIQESEIRAVGSNRTKKVDVRFITAASTSLQKFVETQLFREDLYYRLYVYPIYVPMLEERQDDIPLLAHHFLLKFAGQQRKPLDSFHGSIINFMKNRKWPGNIRELENFVERLVTLAYPESTSINHDVLPAELKNEYKKAPSGADPFPQLDSLKKEVAVCEARCIRHALEQSNWNRSKAARALKISERTIRYKIRNLGIKCP